MGKPDDCEKGILSQCLEERFGRWKSAVEQVWRERGLVVGGCSGSQSACAAREVGDAQFSGGKQVQAAAISLDQRSGALGEPRPSLLCAVFPSCCIASGAAYPRRIGKAGTGIRLTQESIRRNCKSVGLTARKPSGKGLFTHSGSKKWTKRRRRKYKTGNAEAEPAQNALMRQRQLPLRALKWQKAPHGPRATYTHRRQSRIWEGGMT